MLPCAERCWEDWIVSESKGWRERTNSLRKMQKTDHKHTINVPNSLLAKILTANAITPLECEILHLDAMKTDIDRGAPAEVAIDLPVEAIASGASPRPSSRPTLECDPAHVSYCARGLGYRFTARMPISSGFGKRWIFYLKFYSLSFSCYLRFSFSSILNPHSPAAFRLFCLTNGELGLPPPPVATFCPACMLGLELWCIRVAVTFKMTIVHWYFSEWMPDIVFALYPALTLTAILQSNNLPNFVVRMHGQGHQGHLILWR